MTPDRADAAEPDLRLGVDIGGTKLAAAVVDVNGRIVERFRRPTPRTGSGADVIAAIIDLIDEIRAGVPIRSIGLGAKGVIDTEHGVVVDDGDTLPGWSGTDVAGPIVAATSLPVAVNNDVRVTALGEARRGAGIGIDRLLVAAIGTGVGGGLVFGGSLVTGRHGTTGEIAHLYVGSSVGGGPALPCGCGRLDHLEAVAAGPAIAAEYGRRTGITGLSLHDVAERMRDGDADARATIRDAARVLGLALAGFATSLDVDGVVIGGGVAQIGSEFFDPAAEAFADSAFSGVAGIAVLPAALGTDAPLIGAAELHPVSASV